MGKNEERFKGTREIASYLNGVKGVEMTENERRNAEIRSIMKSVAPKAEKAEKIEKKAERKPEKKAEK